MTHTRQGATPERVAVLAADTYMRMRRMQTVRAIGMDPRPFSRTEDLLLALKIGRRFSLVLATLHGEADDVMRATAMLRDAAPSAVPMLFLRDHEDADVRDVATTDAPAIELLARPFTEKELRARIAALATGAGLVARSAQNKLTAPFTENTNRQEAQSNMASLANSAVVYKSGRPSNRPRIGLLEDSPAEAAAFTELLTAHGCDVLCRSTGTAFLSLLQQESFDLLVLDWNLPDMTGYEVLGKVRAGEWAAVPVLMLTARSGEFEVVQALEAGADEYVAKPWRPVELVARIRVLLRPPPAPTDPSVEKYHGFEFQKGNRTVRGHGIEVALPAKEFEVALLMLRNLGRPLSREHLRQAVWHGESASGRTIDTHVSRLRLKLGLTAESGFSLQAIYGIGYRLERTGEARTES